MAQGEHMKLWKKRHGERLDKAERTRKREAREVHKRSKQAQRTLGLKGKMLTKKRHQEKATMKKTIAMHQERDNKHKADDGAKGTAVPAYLLEREQVNPRHNKIEGFCEKISFMDRHSRDNVVLQRVEHVCNLLMKVRYFSM